MFASEEHVAIVQVLLDNGAKINLQGITGVNALMIAISYGQEEIVKTLLAKGARVDQVTTEQGRGQGLSALHIACDLGNVVIVRALLAKGANVNLQDKNGYTALAYAKTQQIKDLLKAAGATE